MFFRKLGITRERGKAILPQRQYKNALVRQSFKEWWRRLVVEPRRQERPWLFFVVGAVFLFFGFIGYGSGRSYLQWLVGGTGAILYGVAYYLPTRWSAVAIAVRVVFLLSLVAVAVFSVVRVLT